MSKKVDNILISPQNSQQIKASPKKFQIFSYPCFGVQENILQLQQMRLCRISRRAKKYKWNNQRDKDHPAVISYNL
ncbi:unnamed protein product [Paramecium octaurelia]|uniref:Uncharacterized protein n=1 Tax=Paramecium octaurelia TaxID=43137 RepID=A0A8S1YAG6_PAROT|nr:unnamed protein product [Paramecium octaurelia]